MYALAAILLTLPLWYQILIVGALGLIIGSFLNVVIYRFHTGKSLGGSSHCLSCQHQLRWYELLPVVSYLALRARCRQCGSWIPSRYLWVELATGLLFLLVYFTLAQPYLWLWGFVLVSLIVVIAVYDLDHMIIPHAFVWTLGALALLFMGYRWYLLPDWSWVLFTCAGAVATFTFFWGLWAYSKGRWIGLGDAKLALPLALITGPVGAFSMVVLAFWVGTAISLALLGWGRLQTKRGQLGPSFASPRLTIKSEVPFAPFLLAGFILVYFFHVDVLTLLSVITQ